MLGTGRFIETHPDPENIIAAFSMDYLGRSYYDAMNMELIGQYRRFTPLWLALLARDSAIAGDNLWQVNLPSVIDQVTGQAAPVSFMDQGPLIAAGIPALGFAARTLLEVGEEHYRLWHDPGDTMQTQSATSLGQSGLIAEALIHQLFSMETFPQESGPYLYFDGNGQVLRGLPLLASIILLYLLDELRLMDAYARYPATTKDPLLLNPRWPSVIIFLLGLVLFLAFGRWAVRRIAGDRPAPPSSAIKSLALLVVGLAGVYVLVINPFSLLFFLPLLFWFLIGGRHGFGKILDIIFFLLGGLVVYGLIYIFGFQTLRYDFTFLWYMLNMFSIRMLSFASAAMITAIFATGLSMVVNPPYKVQAENPATIRQESGPRLASQG